MFDGDAATALLIAAAGGVGAFLGAWVSPVLNRREQRRQLRREQQKSDAQVLGELMNFLTDIEPQRLGLFTTREAATRKGPELGEQYGRVYGSLVILTIGHPAQRVRDVAAQSAQAVRKAAASSGMHLHAILKDSSMQFLEKAKTDHKVAWDCSNRLIAEVVGYGEGSHRRLPGLPQGREPTHERRFFRRPRRSEP